MKLFQYLFLLGGVAGFVGFEAATQSPAAAQELNRAAQEASSDQTAPADAGAAEGIPVNPSVTKLDEDSRRMMAALAAMDRYLVEVVETWALDGDRESSGVNRFRLAAWHEGAFDLTIQAEGGTKQSLECHSDGVTLTRLLDRPTGAIYSKEPGKLEHLLDEVMTETSLRNSGLDLLYREAPAAYLMSMASEIEFLGVEELAVGKADHFRFHWAGDRAFGKEIWITTGNSPRLVQVVSRIEFATGQEKPHTLEVKSELVWQAGDPLPEDPPTIKLPAEARQVNDLYGYLLEGATRDLIGQPAPQLSAKLLDGSTWNLAQHRDKEWVVIYFFSTWAGPSLAEMPVILEFIEKFQPKGVAFYAVNVGEDPQTVSEFVKAKGYRYPVVLDSDRQASTAFGVTSLPAMVLVGKDGVLKTSHVGNTPEVRSQFRQEIEVLMGIEPEQE